jgi:uncharacterized membrane protein
MMTGVRMSDGPEVEASAMTTDVQQQRAVLPTVNTLSIDDLLDVLAAGIRDFRTAPAYGLFFGGIYVFGGWLLILLLLYFELPFLVYPLAAGFALIAPFVACGFYVVSQYQEAGDELNWGIVFGTVKSMFARDLGWMALVTGFSLFIWMDIAALLSFGFMGFQLFSFSQLIELIFTTPLGLLFLFVGNLAGAIIAFAVFSYSVISIPMLFHRDIDFVTAMITSVRLVIRNPRTMALWCIIIAGLMTVSLLSGLIGLIVTLPVLGHATWHLYRRGVA